MLETLLAALIPVGIDGIKAVIGKFSDGVKPASVEDVAKLANIEIEKLKALAELDRPIGNPSQWVVDLRASFRYIAIMAIWVITIVILPWPEVPVEIKQNLLSLSGATLSFIIGERALLGFKRGLKK